VLQKYLDEHNMTAKAVALLLGINYCSLIQYINMQAYPTNAITMKKICDFVGKPAEELFPPFLNEKNFLKIKKCVMLHKNIDLKYLTYQDTQKLINYNQLTPEDEIIAKETREGVLMVLEQLGEREKKILIEYFFNHKTTAEISKENNISIARIGQIKHRALNRLKWAPWWRKLKRIVYE